MNEVPGLTFRSISASAQLEYRWRMDPPNQISEAGIV